MYRGNNGFILVDAGTKWGWEIKSPQDIITALLGYPAFETVAEGFLWEALGAAVEDRKEYANIDELAQYLARNYI